ncbi:phosphotransferase [Pseudomonas lopnurensis]|uniref:phosphotransferase n=1 Tax=Pseudomonas lopnurensis TaxID=1477517 RepID=UPI0028AD9EC4|nr:phosphotransferase [Pseudomonas lopnurensis]
MGLKQEKRVLDMLAAWGDGIDGSRPEVERILSAFAENIEWQLWVPGGPVIRGRDALRAEIERQMGYVTNNHCNTRNILSTDRLVMTERDDYCVNQGRPMPHSMVAVYELDEDGLICAWREYLDTADLARKKGVPLAEAAGPQPDVLEKSMQATESPAAAVMEQKLRAFVERLTGGRITGMERLPRWRPAWNLSVENDDGSTLGLHIRGERGGDVSPFPDLRREADILTLLGAHGVPVPKIHGYCEDPQAIVMDWVPGTRDLSGMDENGRRTLARQYVEAMAAMHQLPLAPFVEKGIAQPRGVEAIGLAGLTAYYPLYERNKTTPQPLIEFALGWLRRNVPVHRTRPSFVQYDSGQYLHQDGKVQALYDFEFAMIGDPLADLASARMRDNYEPLGECFADLYRYYCELTGEPAEPEVVRYHTLLFSTVSAMQFSATVTTPKPGDPHDTYIEFDIALRRVVVHALAEAMGVPLETRALDIAEKGPNAALLDMLEDAVNQLEIAGEFQRSRHRAVHKLVEYLGRADAMESELRRLEQEAAEQLLGRRFGRYEEIDAALETFVRQAGAEYDERLLRLFMTQIERRVLVYGGTAIGGSASHIDLPPIL